MPWDRSSSSDSRHYLQMYSKRKICFKISKKWNAQISKVCPNVFSAYTLFPQSIRALDMADWSSKNQNSSPEQSQKQRIRPGMLIWKTLSRTWSGRFRAREGLWCRRNHLRFLLTSNHGHLQTIPVRFYPFLNPSRDSLFANFGHDLGTLRDAFWIALPRRALMSAKSSQILISQRSWTSWNNPRSVLPISESIQRFAVCKFVTRSFNSAQDSHPKRVSDWASSKSAPQPTSGFEDSSEVK